MVPQCCFWKTKVFYENPLGKVRPCPSGGVEVKSIRECFSKNDSKPSLRWTALPYNHITQNGHGLNESLSVLVCDYTSSSKKGQSPFSSEMSPGGREAGHTKRGLSFSSSGISWVPYHGGVMTRGNRIDTASQLGARENKPTKEVVAYQHRHSGSWDQSSDECMLSRIVRD